MARRSKIDQANTEPADEKKPRGPIARWFWRLVWTGVVLGLIGAIGLGVSVYSAYQSLPSYEELKTSQNGQMIVVRAADGTELVSLGPSYGKWLPSRTIPKVMRSAMVSVEDRRFYSHWGVDPIGIARSFMVRYETGRWKQGGSTITQQLARTIFLNNSRDFGRKLREAVLALAMERKFSKDQILELYLNKVYFGGGAYGIDSASRKFFGHPGTSLSLEESAIIAGLVKAPSNYSPTADAKAAIGRAGVVLQVMQANGTITAEQAAAADVKGVKLAPEKAQNSVRYFTDWALPQLDMIVPDTKEPIEVWTTLDLGMQQAATAAIASNVPAGSQGALVSMDRDGAVLAMVGGTDYVTSNYNRAVNAVRQPGSAWKLFVYLAALESGHTPEDRVVDEPVTIDNWTPRNSGGSYAGEIDIRTAFAYSKNTVAAQLGAEVGFGAVASMARRFGITTPINTLPSMVLGTSDVRVIDMTTAFAAVSAKGASIKPYGITRVETVDGKVLYRHQPTQGQLLVPPYVAAGITDLLQSAVSTGTGRAAQIGRPVAGKTGTTSSNKDGWFLGFSSGITTGVWMGRDDAKPVGGLQGGTAPARAFASYMRFATARRPVEQFDTELKLPDWQLEADNPDYYGEPGDYYYVDENGKLVKGTEPGVVKDDGSRPYDDEGKQPAKPAGPAASDDFLNEATGGPSNSSAPAAPPPAAPANKKPPAAQPVRLGEEYGDG